MSYKKLMKVPTETQNISANGTYDVTDKASAVVNVPSLPTQTKSITLGSVSPSAVTPDSGYVLSSVTPNIDTSVIKASNIAQGVNILGVSGTLSGSVSPRFICVGDSGQAYYSIQGGSWVAMSGLNSSINFKGKITYGNGRFMCLGEHGEGYYSTNGTTWTAMSGSSGLPSYYGITYGINRFVCVGDYASSKYSLNGTSWSSSNPRIDGYGIAYGNGMFVIISHTDSSVSPTGINWNSYSNVINDANGITYGNGRFICVGNNGESYYSTDGISWTAMTGLDSSSNFYSVAYGYGRFICVGNNGKSYNSWDGVSWISSNSGLDSGYTIRDIIYAYGKYVCVGDGGKSYYLNAGELTWYSINGLPNSNFYGVTHTEWRD